MRAYVSAGPPRHAAHDGDAGSKQPASRKIEASVRPSIWPVLKDQGGVLSMGDYPLAAERTAGCILLRIALPHVHVANVDLGGRNNVFHCFRAILVLYQTNTNFSAEAACSA